MIRKATDRDIQAIADTYDELLTHEEKFDGHSNWKLGVYPTIDVPKEKVPLGMMYVLEEDGEICASMVLNQDQPAEYADVPWEYIAEDDKVLVIHTLCIPPSKSRRGYGSAMIDFAKSFAHKHDCEVIRMDTFAHNEPAKNLYLKNGFRIAGYGKMVLQGLIEEDQVYLEYRVSEDGSDDFLEVSKRIMEKNREAYKILAEN